MSEINNQNPSLRSDMSSLYPSTEGFKPNQKVAVGGVITAESQIEYNTGRKCVKCVVKNTGDRPIQVGSHFHFFEVNRYLEFDRNVSFGCHLNIPATTAIRFEPGDSKEVELVAFSGKRRIIGFNGLVMGYTGEEEHPSYLPLRNRSLRRALRAGFLNAAENSSAVEEKHLNNNNNNNNR